MSIASRLSSKGGTTGGLDPIVKDKECCSLKQLKNLPTARLVREMYNFFFQELLDLTLPPKSSNEMILEHLKTLDYPYAVHKSSIMNPNNSSSWPYNLAILAFLKQLYDLAHYSSDEVDDSDFCINDQLNSGFDFDIDEHEDTIPGRTYLTDEQRADIGMCSDVEIEKVICAANDQVHEQQQTEDEENSDD
ncbi:uncharacterized protein LOC142342482 [Convolutriloba macropyga]|uniref:uncharacterized protein LOC142342482 n=1 Tax=Convolutriloba macropyga TaxID=536237 RepID=UPI003F5242F3